MSHVGPGPGSGFVCVLYVRVVGRTALLFSSCLSPPLRIEGAVLRQREERCSSRQSLSHLSFHLNASIGDHFQMLKFNLVSLLLDPSRLV